MNATATSLFDELIADNGLWRDVAKALLTAEHDSNSRVPRVPGGMRAMHKRAESLENIASALAERECILYEHKKQARLRLPKPDRRGFLEIVLSSGKKVADGFAVHKKGDATKDLIGLQHVPQLDFQGIGNAPMRDEGAFLILERVTENTEGGLVTKTVMHLAYPAKLNLAGTFIHCTHSEVVGEFSESDSAAPSPKLDKPEPVKVTPKVGPKPRAAKDPSPKE